jgi:hypothetical protein
MNPPQVLRNDSTAKQGVRQCVLYAGVFCFCFCFLGFFCSSVRVLNSESHPS